MLEVVSRSNTTKDTQDMVRWYGEAGTPAYLVIDPRDGTWTLHTEPRGGGYQGMLHKQCGDGIVLDGLKVKPSTDSLPR